MKTKWDKKMSVALTATMMLSVAPVNVLAKPDAKIVQSEPEEVYVDIIGEGQRSTLFNENWKFHRGDVENAQDVNYNDTTWENINLPHDYSIDQEFTTSGEAESGKEVVVLVELRARFDEENNIDWSKRLEESGCRVIYGLDGLKVHSKICLITCKNNQGIHYVCQIGTGNYNEVTSKLYTDISLMTSKYEIGEEINTIFNHLSLGETESNTQYLMVAPNCMITKIFEYIDEQIELAKSGKEAYVGFKCNSVTSKRMIDKLIEASQAGVKIDMIVRGICCIIPGVQGYTENIRVISIVGRYLEHSRIYIFGKGDNQKVYISSADLMTRNLARRVEVAAPILDEKIKKRLVSMFNTMLKDNVKACELLSDGSYKRIKNKLPELNSQEYFFK